MRTTILAAICAAMAALAPHLACAATERTMTCDRAEFRVFIDVGHSEEGVGATSARGVGEFYFNKRLSEEFAEALRRAGFERTDLLISLSSSREELARRAEAANGAGAHLFISVHHDAVPAQFLRRWTYEGVERPYSDRFPGHSIFVSEYNGDLAGSIAFGKLLGQELKDRGFRYAAHYKESFMGDRRRAIVDDEVGVYRYDELIVLKSTAMPAILFEAGSIIHRAEEMRMNDPAVRAKIVEALVEATIQFCGAQRSR